MNDKIREQIETMKNQTIGVEIEMNNITREKAARKVAEYFRTTAWNAASEYGYYSWACKDGQGRVWKFQRDVSIYGPDAEKCELVTPILTYDDIESLQEIIRLLRKAGAKSSPSRGCGVHIHIGKGDHTTVVKPDIPATGEFKGVGFLEAPRGMLSHWMVIKDGIISNYQAVVPSTWNSGPRNFNDEVGPYERSLVGTPIADPNKPLEVVRTIHSFDPCMSCAVHVVDVDGNEVVSVKVL